MNQQSRIEPLDPLPGKVSFFLDNDPAHWAHGLTTYVRLRYKDIYPGIDLLFYYRRGMLEYDFAVAPGADTQAIRMRVDDNPGAHVTSRGELETTAAGETLLHRPMLYQNTRNGKRAIEGRFAKLSEGEFGFAHSDYDATKELIVDPAITLQYATYIGGTHGEFAYAMAVDAAGNTFVAGVSNSPNYPVSASAYQRNRNSVPFDNSGNGVISKFSPSGVLLYSTYLGGAASALTAIAVDGTGNAYVVAQIDNERMAYGYYFPFPTTPNAFQTAASNVTGTAFAALSPDGSQLIYSSFFGGGVGTVVANSIAVDSKGFIYLAGTANSAGLPTTTGAYQPKIGGNDNSFVAKFDITQTGAAQMVYGTYLGGSTNLPNSLQNAPAYGAFLAVDNSGKAYIGGRTYSQDFPVTANALIPSITLSPFTSCLPTTPQAAGYISILSADGSTLVYSSFIGGKTNYRILGTPVLNDCYPQGVTGLALGPAGEIYLFGNTSAIDLPVKNAFQPTYNIADQELGDGFLMKLSADGTQNLYTTYVDIPRTSSAGTNNANLLAVDGLGDAFVIGSPDGGYVNGVSSLYPASTQNALFPGTGSTMVVEVSPDGSHMLLATALAPTTMAQNAYVNLIYGSSIGVDPQGNIHVAGEINSGGALPVTPNAFQSQPASVIGADSMFLEILGGGGVDTISPTVGGNTGDVTITVRGSGFQTGATCSLTQGDTTIPAVASAVSSDGSSMTCIFALNGALPGNYDVSVSTAGNTFTKSSAFAVQSGGTPSVWANITGRSLIRSGIQSTFEINFGNSGTVDAYDSVIVIEMSPGLTFSFQNAIANQAPPFSLDVTNGSYSIGANGNFLVPTLLYHTPAGYSGSIPIQITSPVDGSFVVGVDLQSVWFDSMSSATQAFASATTNPYPASVACNSTPAKPYLANCLEYWVDQVATALVANVSYTPPNTPVPVTPTADNKAPFRPVILANLQGETYTTTSAVSASSMRRRTSGQGTPQNPYINPPAIDWILATWVAYVENHYGQPLDDPSCEQFFTVQVVQRTQCGLLIQGQANYQVVYTYYYDAQHTQACGKITELQSLDCSQPQAHCVPKSLISGRSSVVSPRTAAQTSSGQQGCFTGTAAQAIDPNQKSGSQGDGSASQFVALSNGLAYNIGFENEATATLPASQVIVTDQLDPTKVDLATLTLGNISFGSTIITPPAGVNGYATTYPINSSMSLRLQGSLNPDNGLLTWTFTTIDPSTGLPPTDPTVGFLPPDTDGVKGQGSVLFTVMPKAGLTTGAPITNQATVVFDANAPINTQSWLNTIDANAPTSSVAALSASESAPTFPVSWSGSDVGSGIATYTVFVSDDGGAYTPWQTAVTATSASYSGQIGHTYAFYSIATDGAGNIQAGKTSPDTTTSVPVSQVGACDVGNYGTVTVADVQQLINESLGQLAGKDDLNSDGNVNVIDVQLVANAALNLGCWGQ